MVSLQSKAVRSTQGGGVTTNQSLEQKTRPIRIEDEKHGPITSKNKATIQSYDKTTFKANQQPR